MAESQVRVVAIDAHSISVIGERLGTCASCNQRSGCSAYSLATKSQKFSLPRPVSSTGEAPICNGDELNLICDDKEILKWLSFIFGPGLLGMVFMPMIVSLFMTMPDWLSLVMVCIGLASGLSVSHYLLRRYFNMHSDTLIVVNKTK